MRVVVKGEITHWDTPQTSKWGKWRVCLQVDRSDEETIKALASTIKEARSKQMKNGKSVQELSEAGAQEYSCIEKSKTHILVKASSPVPNILVTGNPSVGSRATCTLDIYPLYIAAENKAMVVARVESVSVADEFGDDPDDPFGFE